MYVAISPHGISLDKVGFSLFVGRKPADQQPSQLVEQHVDESERDRHNSEVHEYTVSRAESHVEGVEEGNNECQQCFNGYAEEAHFVVDAVAEKGEFAGFANEEVEVLLDDSAVEEG